MRSTRTNDANLVAAAQAGDRQALDQLVTAHLPLVYTIVRRALSDHADVDDVVQDTMVRALRQLRNLHSPESFRPWLAAIAVRRVSTHLHRRGMAVQRLRPLDEILGTPDLEAAFENLTVLQVELSDQRRQVVEAGRWLDPDDRSLLSLWWLEVAGELTRAQLAEALGVSVAHAGVRVQRMRDQLEVSRGVVAALRAQPRCGDLELVTSHWDGQPSPLWRKRIARHVRSCARCSRAGEGRIPAERLLGGFALLVVPVALAAGVLGKISLAAAAGAASTAALAGAAGSAGAAGGAASAKVGLVQQLVHAAAAHPAAAFVAAGALVAGAAVTTAYVQPSAPPARTVVAAPVSPSAVPRAQPSPSAPVSPSSTPTPRRTAAKPSPSAARTSPAVGRTLAPGPTSLEAGGEAGFYASTTDTYGFLTAVGPGSDGQTRQAATFEVVTGLADPACFSFRLPDGRYLRHSSWRIRVFANDGSELFRGDATFCVRAGAMPGTVSLESSNYHGAFIHRRGYELWIDLPDATTTFQADSSFRVRPPLTG
jgi:RNA polymerase sigma factor (sigma-70 family)